MTAPPDLFANLPPPATRAPAPAPRGESLAAIAAALEHADGADRRLDVRLSVHVLTPVSDAAIAAQFDVPRFTGDETAAIAFLNAILPDWWWTVGKCQLNAHASCGPDRDGRDAELLKIKRFDGGFHVDMTQGVPALALCVVAVRGLIARAEILT